MNKKEFFFPSSCGNARIHAVSWMPEERPKAVILLVHGMAEYIDRYDAMCSAYAAAGFAVYGCDHLGHGKSVNESFPLGFFGSNECGSVFVEDQKKLTDIIKEENPGIPVVIYGHSMGSFVARLYISRFGDEVAAAVICGTAGKNPLIGMAKLLTRVLNAVAPQKPGKLLNTMAFMGWNDRTAKRTEFDWLSVDEENVDRYIADPGCGFMFTNNGFRALITLNARIAEEDVFKTTPANLPILLIAGEEDPVGAYGNGVREVEAMYRQTGHRDVTMKLYSNARHELHNEPAVNETVRQDVMTFIDSKMR